MATEDVQQKIDKLQVNMDRLNLIVNGSNNSDVTLDNGTVPTISKFFKIIGDSSSGYVTQAQTAAATATASKDKAEQWANEDENVPVTDGSNTGYSAYHWSKKAEEIVVGGSSGVISWVGLTGAISLSQANNALGLGNSATRNVGSTSGTVAAGDDPRFSSGGVPLGTIIQVYGNGTTVPIGFIKVVPGLEITSTYPEFRTWAIANGWATNGSGNPVFPNTDDALFLRQWRSGQTRDAGRAFGSLQSDAFQDHDHKLPGASSSGNGSSGASYPLWKTALEYFTENVSTSYARSTSYGSEPPVSSASGGKSVAAKTAVETRPANITVTWFIKAYAAVDDPSQVTAASVVDKVQRLRVPTISTSAPSGTGQDGDIWYVI